MPDKPENRTACCIGGMTMDRTLKLQEPGVLGTSNPVVSRRMRGGVARNVAENLARLSVNCHLASIVGDDEAGREVLKITSQGGVDTGLVQKSLSEPTGSCTRVMQPDGSLFASFADIGISKLMDRDFIHNRWLQISGATLVFAETNLPAETLSYLITGCREHELTLVLDAVSVSKARRLPLNLNGVDMLFCNADEARSMLGDDIARDPNGDRDSSSTDDLENMAQALCQRGAKSAVVTGGVVGICFASDGECVLLPASPASISDVSGAGDALIAGTLYGRLMDYDAVTCLTLGLNAAAITLSSDESNSPDLSVEAITAELDL
ncbi:MAG TPA: carbohydrate kinase family protein [Woeseiaceae bacterium]|nr:carbohydrate kinase family protein [Woeseiaceae bacterium]